MDLYSIIAFVISGAICAGLIYFLYDKYQSTQNFEETLNKLTSVYIGISVFLSAILMVFLASSTMTQKSYKAKILEKISKTTQQMHNFRTIAEILFNSDIWLPGLKEYMEKEYANLTYFDVKEFYKAKSKLAIDFLQETHHFGETENLYLELKSLLMTSPNEKHISETISYPVFYDSSIIEKWVEHKSGSGLWFIFGYKYGNYKESLNLDAVFERHREKILTLANTIDNTVFEDSSFNEVFFAKLLEYLTKEIIPKLSQFQSHINRKTPQLIYYSYIVFLLLILFGVLLPLTYLMLNFSVLAIIVSYSIVISTIFFVAITLHVFLSKEENR
ncbi:MAG: hypothetical protein KDC78_01280 [Aequorivita sp.]|nr:hypothetical protein [Aequorivita sp.]